MRFDLYVENVVKGLAGLTRHVMCSVDCSLRMKWIEICSKRVLNKNVMKILDK